MAGAVYKLRSGAEIEVESSAAQPQSSGVDEASALGRLTAGAWNEAMAKVAEIAEQAGTSLRAAAKDCREVAVEFSVSAIHRFGVEDHSKYE